MDRVDYREIQDPQKFWAAMAVWIVTATAHRHRHLNGQVDNFMECYFVHGAMRVGLNLATAAYLGRSLDSLRWLSVDTEDEYASS